MKSAFKPVWAIVFVICGLVAVVGISHVLEPKERIAWGTDFSAAQAESTRTHKPVLAYFTATWCGPCQEMKRTTWSDPKVAAALGDYVPVKIDIDEHPEIAGKFSFDGIPAFAVLDTKGQPVKQNMGYQTSEAFLDWLSARADAPVSTAPLP